MQILHLKYILSIIGIVVISVLFTLSRGSSGTYDGKCANAEWRKNAEKRIAQIRMADLKIILMDTSRKPIKDAPVVIKMQRHAFSFGSAVHAFYLMANSEDRRKYRETILRLFNKAVLEGDLRWDLWEASKKSPPGSMFRMEQTFAALKWLSANDILVRGHRLSSGRVDGRRNLAYTKYKNNLDKVRKSLFEHIREKVLAVGNLVSEWDAVNHPVGLGVTLEELYGPQIYVEIFNKAHAFNSKTKLYTNEGEILTTGDRIHVYERIIRYLIDHQAPIDGIGFMGHFFENTLTPPLEVLNVLDRFAAFGLPLLITEFDVRFGKKGKLYDFTKEELQLQADYTRDFMTAVFSHPAVEGIVLWGFWEGRHWYPGAALYRKDWSVKPNGRVWDDLVHGKWWTDIRGETDANGLFKARGFLGDYIIEVNCRGKIKKIPAKLESGGKYLEIILD